mgnify:CR=1 FL=1|jgi:5-methylthioribose kinase
MIVSLFLMMADCIMNTWVVTMTNLKKPWRIQCNTEIFENIVGYLGFIAIYIARMWRVYKMYTLY